MACTYNEYHTDFKGILSQADYEKYIVGAESNIDIYGLDDTKVNHRFAIYEIVDYISDHQVSNVYKSESADGYSYQRFENLDASYNASIYECIKRWVGSTPPAWIPNKYYLGGVW